ncbi:hypothetical protein GFS24_01995 [Chitinophaga sp. SYP-B3965]|uniref:sensor histidine kinase n=1 Tax=Chitinophaga sp. SYP-B3965 TaxID=2663120 RepID=UPI00129A0ADC|nr:HAMP domain-containing sensor histidine kinase [Chitinophaga sp. SYP-B3965]MRG43863.1 hypothetical protein [Chitinophaga sp. SYP-B3965]
MKSQQYIKVSHLMNGIKEPVLLIDPSELTVLKANDTAVELLGGGKRKAITGKPLQMHYGNGQQLQDMILPSPGDSFIITTTLTGSKILIDFKANRININRKPFLLAIGKLIEKKQTLKLQLQHLEKEKALHEMKANFMSMTSHEFRTPLTAIASAVDLLEARLQMDGMMNSFYQHNVSKVSTEVFNLNSMLDEILTLSKIMSNNYEVKKAPVDVMQVLNYLKFQYFSERKDERILNLKISGEPRKISVDKNQLSKILTNLISNAFKYSVKKNPSIQLSYHKHKLVIKVFDYGIGIPAKDIPHLFNSFYRGSNVDHIEGTGLGLAIVKTFTEMNNGTIDVTSEENKGTTFTLSFRYEP